ncbi:MAG: amidase domain-containing protein [Clostridia bacterium]|nr:amidase domain-containing protein [Clostridia bacterium]
MKKYDRAAAVRYARAFALTPNPTFYHFGGIGGDCTNYISQCLLAGGGVMQYDKEKGWYYNSAADRSPSWTSVQFLQQFLLDTSLKGPKAEIVALKRLEEGDIIQLRQNPSHFNHTLFVSKITQNDIYVCAHSNDALDRKLSSYNYLQLLPLHIISVE